MVSITFLTCAPQLSVVSSQQQPEDGQVLLTTED